MTGYQLITTRTPTLRKVIDYVRSIDFYGDDHGEVKVLLCGIAIFIALDGVLAVLVKVAKLFGLVA